MKKKTKAAPVSKIQKMKDEYAANNEKISTYQTKIGELQERNRYLAVQITSEENTEIVGLVRGINMSPDQLAQFLVHIGKREDGSDPEAEPEDEATEASGNTEEETDDEA